VESHKFKVAMAADMVALWHNGRITVDRGQKEVSAAAPDRTRIGDRLRNGLDELAAKWVPEGKKQTIRTWRPREAIPRESVEAARGTTLVTPSPVAHATSRGVKISGAA
jgi:hypothetical protein